MKVYVKKENGKFHGYNEKGKGVAIANSMKDMLGWAKKHGREVIVEEGLK